MPRTTHFRMRRLADWASVVRLQMLRELLGRRYDGLVNPGRRPSLAALGLALPWAILLHSQASEGGVRCALGFPCRSCVAMSSLLLGRRYDGSMYPHLATASPERPGPLPEGEGL
jgi:hypothetical protein